jgi:aspartyl-tRNA synthetase
MSNKRTLIVQTVESVGKEVLLKGWVRIVRSHGKLIFIDLRDGSGMVQIVVNPQVSEKAHKEALALRPEFTIELTGTVKKDRKKQKISN